MRIKLTQPIAFILICFSFNSFSQSLLKSISTNNARNKKNPSSTELPKVNENQDTDKTTDLSGLGSFMFNNTMTVQSLNVFANFNSEIKSEKLLIDVSSSLYGIQKPLTIGQDSVGLALLIPENSLWGVNFSMSLAYIKIKDFAIAGGVRFDYASKKINARDAKGEVTDTYQIGQFLIRPGLELAYKDNVSVYVNWDWNAMATGIDDFKKAFKNTSTLNYSYLDFGLRGRYILTKDKNTAINLDFNFIKMNDDLKIIYNTNDIVIPLVRLGFSQTFALSKK